MEKVRKNHWKVKRKKQLDKKSYDSLDLDSKVSVIEARSGPQKLDICIGVISGLT